MSEDPIANILQELGPRLSLSASIHQITKPRDFERAFTSWSDFNKKEPSAVVKVITEKDAIETVLWATSNLVPFAIKGGGHSVFCTIGKGGIIIDLTNFNNVKVHEKTVDAQGGALVEDIIPAVFKRGRCVVTGTCDKVGVTGAVLGGGFGPVQSVHGIMLDNLVSARVITADGQVIIASESENPDLFWALRGAGQRFGLVTQVTLKTHDINTLGSTDGSTWNGLLVWETSQLGKLTEALDIFNWNSRTAAYLMFICSPPTFKPTIITVLHFFGSDEEAATCFEPLLSMGPLVKQTQRTPYDLINWLDNPGGKSRGKRSQFGTGVQTIKPGTMVEIYKEYSKFITTHPDASESAVIVEIFGMDKVREVDPESTAFAHRDVKFWTFPVVSYEESDTEADATNFGNKARQLFRDGDSRNKLASYVNFNRGDESPEMTYGSREQVEKLLKLKRKWDPSGVFGGLVPQLG